MLENEALFDEVEAELKKRGSIQEFEEKYGKITGRMMITETEIPEELGIEINDPDVPLLTSIIPQQAWRLMSKREKQQQNSG